MKSNLHLNNEIKILQKENEELKTRLSINSKIIQEFFKNSNINEKVSLFIENIKKENNILLNEIKDLKQQNQKMVSLNENKSDPNKKSIEAYENKLFIYENLLKEKQSIIVNLKEQNKNLQSFIDSNITKKEINQNLENEIEKESNNNFNNSNDKYIIEEIYVISPQQLINTLNDKIELYKDINTKLKNLIQEMKCRYINKDKEFLKLEEELTNLKQELQNLNKTKNNEEIMNQLIQYQSMKSLPISQSCSNFHFNSHNFKRNKNKNTRNKKTRSLSYINNHTHDLTKIMKEIEVYENVNKTVKEISQNDFDLTEEWAETLKQCGMTQEEFLKFCGMKITNKLTNAIEYMYKILVDKNIQIKLLTKENETLNEENIRLNKINIQMETLVDFYEKSEKDNKNNNKNFDTYENIFDSHLNKNKKNKKIKSNTFFDKEKLKNKKIFNNSSPQNKLQKTYVNVDNNITHTNININMMMDYNNRNDTNKNLRSNTLNKNKTAQDNLVLDESSTKNDKKDEIKNLKNFDILNKSENEYKSSQKLFKYIKWKNKKIKNNSYNKLIKEKKNELICKTLNLSNTNIKKPKKVFGNINNNSFNYNKTIKSIFSNTEKIFVKNKERNTVSIGNNKNNKNLNSNMNLNNFFTDFKLSNKYKRIINKNENI